MVRVALVVALAALLAGGGVPTRPVSALPARAAAGEPKATLGIVDGSLVRLHPHTLRPLPGPRVAVGTGGCTSRQGGTACWSVPPWAASPDGSRVAIARNDLSRVRVVDAASLRVLGDVPWRADGGLVGALAWVAPRRLLALQETFAGRQRVAVVDLRRGRIVGRTPLPGAAQALARVPGGLVALLAPHEGIGPARLALVDGAGRMRSVRLERIAAGVEVAGEGTRHAVEIRSPGLAVDAAGRRAFVLAEGLAAEVSLRALEVSYHRPQAPRSLLSRLLGWLEGTAHAKRVAGYQRAARWLGNSLLAVAGTDSAGAGPVPAGLQLLDVRDWTLRTLEPDASAFTVADGLLLATGGRLEEDGRGWRGLGLAAFALDGTPRFRLFPGEQAWLALVYRGRAYVGDPGGTPLRVVDLATGAVVGARSEPLPSLVLGSGSGWWG